MSRDNKNNRDRDSSARFSVRIFKNLRVTKVDKYKLRDDDATVDFITKNGKKTFQFELYEDLYWWKDENGDRLRLTNIRDIMRKLKISERSADKEELTYVDVAVFRDVIIGVNFTYYKPRVPRDNDKVSDEREETFNEDPEE